MYGIFCQCLATHHNAAFVVHLAKNFRSAVKEALRKTTLKLTAVRINGKRFFQIISPCPGGGRIRQTFKDQTEAEEHYALAERQIASYGAAAMLITDTLRIAAIEADRLLQPYGKTIVDAAQYYAAHLKAISNSATVSQAIKKLTEDSKDCSVRYRRDLKYRFGKFEKEFGARTLAEIKTGELDVFLNGLKLGSQRLISKGEQSGLQDAHPDDGRRFVVRADEILTAFLELESTIRTRQCAPADCEAREIKFDRLSRIE